MSTHESRGQGLVYGATRALASAAVRGYFRRLDLRHAERLPARGPVMLVANHPASLTDALILGVLVGRRLRFVGSSELFRFPAQAAFLRACGVLPICRPDAVAGGEARNAATFAACHEGFDRGEVVVMFPEGWSRTDRALERFRTGAARMALTWVPRPAGPTLPIVPAGLTFSQRGAFRSDVTLSLGPAIRVPAGPAGDDPVSVHHLTGRIVEGIRHEIAPVGESHEGLAHAVEALALGALARAHGGDRLESRRAIAAAIERASRRDPIRLARFERRLGAYRVRLAALGLDASLLDPERRSSLLVARLRWAGALVMAAGPVLAGYAIHAPVYAIALLAGRIFGRDPTYVSFARITAGLATFAIEYALLALGLARAGSGAFAIAAVLAASAVLGWRAPDGAAWLGGERRRLRLAVWRHGRPAAVAALRTRGLRLLGLVRTATRERRVARPQLLLPGHAEALA